MCDNLSLLYNTENGCNGCNGACVREPPPNALGGDHSAGPWQRKGAVGEGGPAHDDY